MRCAGVGDPRVDRQPDVLLAEVDLDGAWQGQLARGQDAAELPQPGGLGRDLVRPGGRGAADAAVPAPAATASDVLAATAAASTAISPRFLAGTRLKIRRFTFWSSFSPETCPFGSSGHEPSLAPGKRTSSSPAVSTARPTGRATAVRPGAAEQADRLAGTSTTVRSEKSCLLRTAEVSAPPPQRAIRTCGGAHALT